MWSRILFLMAITHISLIFTSCICHWCSLSTNVQRLSLSYWHPSLVILFIQILSWRNKWSSLRSCLLTWMHSWCGRPKVKDMLGDDWVQRQRRIVQQHANAYQRAAWAKVTSFWQFYSFSLHHMMNMYTHYKSLCTIWDSLAFKHFFLFPCVTVKIDHHYELQFVTWCCRLYLISV
jgi:hypothetical protein